MQRIQGYRIDGSPVSDGNQRPDIFVIVDKGLEIRRDSSSRNADEFRAEMTLEEAQQLYAALGELLPKAPKPTTEETFL